MTKTTCLLTSYHSHRKLSFIFKTFIGLEKSLAENCVINQPLSQPPSQLAQKLRYVDGKENIEFVNAWLKQWSHCFWHVTVRHVIPYIHYLGLWVTLHWSNWSTSLFHQLTTQQTATHSRPTPTPTDILYGNIQQGQNRHKLRQKITCYYKCILTWLVSINQSINQSISLYLTLSRIDRKPV